MDSQDAQLSEKIGKFGCLQSHRAKRIWEEWNLLMFAYSQKIINPLIIQK
jgi:hypothetical protein